MILLGTRNHIDCAAPPVSSAISAPTGEKTGPAVYFDAHFREMPSGRQRNTVYRCILIRAGHKADFKVGADASRGSVAVTARSHARRARKNNQTHDAGAIRAGILPGRLHLLSQMESLVAFI